MFKTAIIIPLYNAEKYIIETLSSIKSLPQDYTQVIIIDDGSTDNSCHLVEEFIRNENITNIILEKQANQGVSSARNRGIRLARADWIYFLDADDLLIPVNFIDFMQCDPARYDIVIGNFLYFYKSGYEKYAYNSIKDGEVNVKTYITAFLSGTGITCVSSSLYSLKKVQELNLFFKEEYKYAEDQDFFLSYVFNGVKIYKINKIILKYRQHPDSAVNKKSERQVDAVKIFLNADYLNILLKDYKKFFKFYFLPINAVTAITRIENIKQYKRKSPGNYDLVVKIVRDFQFSIVFKYKYILIYIFKYHPVILKWLYRIFDKIRRSIFLLKGNIKID